LYRPAIRDAFQAAWKEKRYWFIALFAGILLTGSIYDVVWRGLNSLSPQASITSTLVPFWAAMTESWAGLTLTDTILGGVGVFLITTFCIVVAFSVFGASCIAQGALVYAMGNRRRGETPGVRAALTVGSRAIWPVATLNLFALAVLWAVRSLISIALVISVTDTTVFSYLIYLTAFVVFVTLAVAVVIIQIFALNAMILQGATLAQAIERGVMILRRHWVISLETAAILFVLSIGAWILTIAVNMLLAIPLFMLSITAAVLNVTVLFWATLYVGILLFILILLAIAGFMIVMHYATWTVMFRRLGEGGAMPKVHRFFRSLFGLTHVPGA